jgi:hypothetical protein
MTKRKAKTILGVVGIVSGVVIGLLAHEYPHLFSWIGAGVLWLLIGYSLYCWFHALGWFYGNGD